MAQARRLAAAIAVLTLAGCGGSSSPKPPTGGPTLRLAIAGIPRTLDPARVADLPSLNVAHELYAGLTRFSGRGVVPDLAESWEPSENGLVWTFHLRKGIRWSDGEPITAEDFRRSWLRALDPAIHSAYARAEMLNVRGALRYHATGSGEVGVEAVNDRTLRVTLEHPVPWLDQQVAYPVFFPVRTGAWSGPFRLASRREGRFVLERNRDYWNAAAVKPRRVILTTSTSNVDAILPRGVAAPGFPWIGTARDIPPGARELPTLATGLLWLVTRGTPLAEPSRRQFFAHSVVTAALDASADYLVPRAIPGAPTIDPEPWYIRSVSKAARLHLTIAYAREDAQAALLAPSMRRALQVFNGLTLTLKPVPTLRQLLSIAGPPAQPGIDAIFLGWSAEFFDAYNILDLFPCASALNVARWCDRSYDRLMHRAVRTLDDRERWRLESELVSKLKDAAPVVPLYSAVEHVFLKPGVRGFRWSPIGFYELAGMTRS
ncbi:MAG TPA: peptide ABC transporter substrate-binding protein [Gaiellaceae bacterium]|jgi:oligopeptide transport system substrate-binding protein